MDLWQGSIRKEDLALQLFLVIDYICDWARDVYRPSILKCLQAIYNQQTAVHRAIRETSPIDSNIWSLKHPSTTAEIRGPINTSILDQLDYTN
jgi:hypothetical protein